MNGPCGMFKVEPYFDYSKSQIELPTCMFKMKNIHDTQSGSQTAPEQVKLDKINKLILVNKFDIEFDHLSGFIE